jgi:hypothetical protein
MVLESILGIFISLAHWTLENDTRINVYLLSMAPNVLFAQKLATGLAENAFSSSHHIFIHERLH